MIDGVHYFEPGCALTARGGEGAQFLEWLEIGKRWKIDHRYNSMVTAINGNARRVEGVRVLDPDGEYDLEAQAVILCSGGFQSDPQMRARYLGRNSDFMKVRGSRHNTGEVLMMALDLGAKPSGQWLGAHASPIDANAPAVEMPSKTIRYSYVLGITVNALGARFFDEGEAESVYTYAKTGWAVQDQPGGSAFQIVDHKLVPYLRKAYADASVHEAPTLRELADRIGVRPELLERTIADYNAAVRDDVEFKPRERDGKCTVGITPPKSNWATKIDTPPFRAYPVAGGITFTFGGLAVTPNAQVQNRLSQPIAGLYASGDILGLFFHNYPSFSGQTAMRSSAGSPPRTQRRAGARRTAKLAALRDRYSGTNRPASSPPGGGSTAVSAFTRVFNALWRRRSGCRVKSSTASLVPPTARTQPSLRRLRKLACDARDPPPPGEGGPDSCANY